MRIRFIRIFSPFSGQINGYPICNQPVLLVGKGVITFGKKVQIGYFPSPYYYESYTHLEARSSTAQIILGDNIKINNCLTIICDSTTIEIGSNVYIGHSVEIIDSDFHALNPLERSGNTFRAASVKIGNHVFIGSRVTILKGVTLGDNCVVAHSAVVTKSFPDNSIIGGNPAKLIGSINV